MPIQYPQFDAKKGYPKDENFFSFQKEGRQKALDKKRSSFYIVGVDPCHTIQSLK